MKKCRQLRCTGWLRSSKLVHLYGKKLACFTGHLMQNLMHLVFFSKSNTKWLKKGLKLRQSGKTPIGVVRKLPYRTKQSEEIFRWWRKFCPTKILTDKKFCPANNFVQHQISEYCQNSQMSLNSSNPGLVNPFKWSLCKKIYWNSCSFRTILVSLFPFRVRIIESHLAKLSSSQI